MSATLPVDYKTAAAAKYAAWCEKTAHPLTPIANETTNLMPAVTPPLPTLTDKTIDTVAASSMKMDNGNTFIYVLLCGGGKYYVGETYNVEERFMQHLNGVVDGKITGAAWTKKYEPIEVVKKFVKQSVHDEDNTTLDYMVEHGIRNVRGGSYCQVHLPKHLRKSIKQKLATIKKLCYRCKKPGHCANNCPAATATVQKRSWIDCDSEEDEPALPALPAHTSSLVATDNKMFSFDNGLADSKERAPLKQSEPECLLEPLPLFPIRRPTLYAPPPSPLTTTSLSTSRLLCTRCGRNNHSHLQCFAKQHLHGHFLPPK